MAKYFGIGKESSYGVAVVPSVYIDPLNESLKGENVLLRQEAFIRRELSKIGAGPFRVSGDVEVVVIPDNIGKFLEGIFGKVTTTASPSSDAYKHEFEVNNTLPSYTIEIGYDVGSYAIQIPGAGFNELSLEAPAKEFVTARISVIGKTAKLESLSTPTVITGRPFVFHDGEVKIDGSTVANVEAIRLTLSNNIDADVFYIGSRTLGAIKPQGFDITGTMDISFDNWDFYQKFLGSASATEPQDTLGSLSLELTFTGEATGSSDTGYEYKLLKIEIPEIYLSKDDIDISGRDRIVQKLEFTGVYNTSAGYAVKATLINTESSP